MQKLYLYLASRSKKGIKIITILQGKSTSASKLVDLKKLDLPLIWQLKIDKIIQDHKMLYEPWIESADSYHELKQRLINRDYKELPLGLVPLINLPQGELPKADTSTYKVKQTMLRKKKD